MSTPSTSSTRSVSSTKPPRPAGTSDIDYVDFSWGPWRGCPPISEACENCYAHTALARWSPNIDWTQPHRTSASTWHHPLAKARDGSWKWPSGSTVFVCPQSDWFLDVPLDWRREACRVIEQRPDLVWVFVTKRPPRPGHIEDAQIAVLPNIPRTSRWLLVTTENQARLDERLPAIQAARAHFGVVGLSLSPLLGPIDLTWAGLHPTSNHHMCVSVEGMLRNREFRGMQHTDGRPMSRREAETVLYKLHADGVKLLPMGDACEGFSNDTGCPGHPNPRDINWVVIEWESGAGARPTDPNWARAVIAQCRAAGVPVYLKQITRPVSGRRIALDQWPEDLRVRELPEDLHVAADDKPPTKALVV